MRAAACALALLLPACVDAPFDLAPELDVERGALSDAFPAGDLALVSTLRQEASIIFAESAPESLGVGFPRLPAARYFHSYVEMDVDVSQLPDELTDRVGSTYEVRSVSGGMCRATLTGFVLAKDALSFPDDVDAYSDPSLLKDPEWLWTHSTSSALLLGTLDSECPAVELGTLAVAEGASLAGVFFAEPEEYAESAEAQRIIAQALDVVHSQPGYAAVKRLEEEYWWSWGEEAEDVFADAATLDELLDMRETFFHDPSGRRLLSIVYASGGCAGSPNELEMLFEIEPSPGGGDTLLLREESGSHTTDERLLNYGFALDRDGDSRFARLGWESFSSEEGEALYLMSGQEWD